MLIYKIHPAIGVARVGNSPSDFFIGPEKPGDPGVEIAPGGAEAPIGKYKSAGQIKRQGARFRVFEYDQDPNTKALTLKREITADGAQIEWKVDLVNRKAAFDRVIQPGVDPEVAPQPRNTSVTGPARLGLIIRDKRDRTISGPNAPAVLFDNAEFAVPDNQGTIRKQTVYLGELRTDKLGRLIVLGGRGISGSPLVPPPTLDDFANNDGWHDDVADGPVTATLTFPNQAPRQVDAPAWVTVAPPDFAPAIDGVVTLYDVAFQAAIDAQFLKAASKPSFQFDIMPIIRRAANLRFVNNFSFWNSIPRQLAVLAQNGAASATLRQQVFELLITDLTDPGGPLRNVVIPDFINTYFNQYVADDFQGGLNTVARATTIPEDLDRAALEACVGLNFFPGIEGSQNLRHKAIYSEPFRIDHSASEVFPGFLTEIMAVPWQADFLDCRNRWWPSQRPDFVMTDPANIPGSTAKWAMGLNIHEDMVAKFATLPFVVPMQVGGETVFVQETP
jgi:hypothetical protein